MITKLTPEQEAQLPIYAEKWRKIGLSTEPANRLEAERGIRLAYELESLPSPEIIWSQSPAQMRDIYFSDRMKNIKWGVHHLVYDKKISQTGVIIAKYIDEKLLVQIRKYFGYTIGDNIFDHIWDGIDDLFQINDLCYMSTYATYTYEDFGFYDYCNHVLKLELSAIQCLMMIAKHAGWWLPCTGFCFVNEPYTILRLDDDAHPHCEDGLAIGYADGWGIYAWHGVQVPEFIIMRPHEITSDTILSDHDVQVAGVMLERYGIEKFIREQKFSPVHSNNLGDIYHIELKQSRSLLLLTVGWLKNSNQFRVLSRIRHVQDAIRWLQQENKCTL